MVDRADAWRIFSGSCLLFGCEAVVISRRLLLASWDASAAVGKSVRVILRIWGTGEWASRYSL